MGRVEKGFVIGVAILYLGLLGVLLAFGKGAAVVLVFLAIIVKATIFYAFVKHAATMGTGARRRTINATALLQGRST